jgi:hypothetical protein
MGFITIFLTLILSFGTFAQGGGGHGGGGPGIILNTVSDFEFAEIVGGSGRGEPGLDLAQIFEGTSPRDIYEAKLKAFAQKDSLKYFQAGEVVDLESRDPAVGVIDPEMALELYADRIKRIDGKLYIREDAPIINYQDSLGVVRSLE